MTKNNKLVDEIKNDFQSADICEADKVMLEYVVKLTKQSCSVSQSDIETLRDHEFDDRAILDIVQITSYFNFVNRLACGLGVELEEYMVDK